MLTDKVVTLRSDKIRKEHVMIDVIKIASYVSQRYEYEFGSRIDEMKLHILLYFMQRESIVQTGQPLFADVISVNKGGLYIASVHTAYEADALHDKLSGVTFAQYQSVLDHVFATYAHKDMMGLTTLVQSEWSWKRAMERVNSDKLIQIRDIAKDAERIRNRRFLLKHLQDFRKPVYA